MLFSASLSPQFLKLLELTGICKKGFFLKMIEETQQKWYQPGERWDFHDKFEKEAAEILPLIDEMGLFEEKRASFATYDYCLVLGGHLANVEKRFAFLIEEYNRGTSFKTLVFLTGQRPLDFPVEKLPEDSLTTETDMMKFVWNHMKNLPKGLEKLQPIIVDAPALPVKGRPTTESTVIEWLKTNPKPGRVLSVSSAPYIGYQNSVVTNLLFPDFQVDTIGCSSNKDVSLSILIDNLAKWFLWEARLMNKLTENLCHTNS